MEFTKPQSLNGAQLKTELKAKGIDVKTIDDLGNGSISFEVPKPKETDAESIVSQHVGIDRVPTIAEKLASIDLDLNQLKAALA